MKTTDANTELKNELKELLSGLWTDANMALNDDWDRSDEGFEAQIELIEQFADKHGIQLTDNRP